MTTFHHISIKNTETISFKLTKKHPWTDWKVGSLILTQPFAQGEIIGIRLKKNHSAFGRHFRLLRKEGFAHTMLNLPIGVA